MARSARFDPDGDATIIRQMAQKLSRDIWALERVRERGTPRTVPEFRAVRDLHGNVHALVMTIQERSPAVQDRLPEGFRDWIMRARLRALTCFAEIAREFVRDPPLALTQSLTARDVLESQKATIDDARAFFNNVVMEYAVDDKTAGELDRTSGLIDEISTIVDRLLEKSSNHLIEF